MVVAVVGLVVVVISSGRVSGPEVVVAGGV